MIFPQRKEEESRRVRGEEMDAMLIERDRKLAEKEAYIVHLQTALSGDESITPAPPQVCGLDPTTAQPGRLQLVFH